VAEVRVVAGSFEAVAFPSAVGALEVESAP
jgi:hypothetical protein